jgi:aminoglycoside phosphotransferase (APT) family kinase protein
MVDSADGANRVLTAAAAKIGELHRSTASSTTVETDALERWVNGPAFLVRQVGATFAGRAAAKVATERLVGELREALGGRAVPVGWTHGDFVPSNILMSAWGASVLGIVDWELADPADLTSLDMIALLIATRVQQRRQEIGQVVRECVTGAPWTEFERDLLDSASSGLPGARIDPRTLALLWWLRHVAGNLTKSTRYARSRLWARWNVMPVLDVFSPR